MKNDSLEIIVFLPFPQIKKILEIQRGSGGFTMNGHEILLLVYPGVKGWVHELKRTVVHELHHAYWFTHYDWKKNYTHTLLNRFVFEGQAEYFANLVYPDESRPKLGQEEKERLWNVIQTLQHCTNTRVHDSILECSPDNSMLPGYELGYNFIAEVCKKRPNFTVDSLLNYTAAELVEIVGMDVFTENRKTGGK